MAVIVYRLIGFANYEIINKIMYRKAYRTKSTSCKWQYRNRRKINRSFKDGEEGYWLVKNGKRKFHSLKLLKHKLKKNIKIA